MSTENAPIMECGTARLSDKEWKEAERRASVIRPLAEMETVTTAMADEAAAKLNVSQRTVYTLIQRFRASGGLLTVLAHNVSSGGRGKKRLPATLEQIIVIAIEEIYLSKQKRRAADVVQEVRRKCFLANLKPPGPNAVRARINALNVLNTVKCRNGRNAARPLTAVKGSFPNVASPLDLVQMDHTPIDLIVVDEISRQPIGRPYLTAAIDIYSRCITGFCLTFEAPSAVSVGLCLVHSVIDKTNYLAHLGIEGEWPIWGKPLIIYVDNATEFHSEALRRGCAQHGIQIQYRPFGQPQFGGTIERVIGTLMQHVHTLPGTTFSNIMERGEYDSDGTAILTLSELEKWLTLVIIGQYHNKVHSSIHEPPIERYKSGLISNAKDKPERNFKPLVLNKKAFLVDFLPIVKRSIQRHGFMIDHIIYYSNSLQPWIAKRHQGHKFIIRRDPRDISRIFVLHPEHDEYLEVPYRTLSNPTVTLWEHRESLRQLKERGASKVNEEAIFKTIDAMRKITDAAAAKSRLARRKKARASHLTNQISMPEQSFSPVLCDTQPTETKPAPHSGKLFDNIEEW
jgi:putative transposase